MIALQDIAWAAGGFALEGIDLEVPNACYGVLMGRTGCGKTSLLEILCGLRRPAAGRVVIDGREVTDLPPGARGIGYVPQDGALFPTMTVAEQLGFAPRVQRRPGREITAIVERLAGDLGIGHLLDRRPDGLSGGERGRVALGRALASGPRVLLLDEPLAALDEDTRDEMADLLKEAQSRHGLTALHVTHSRAEAARLADRRFVMEAGVLRGEDPGPQ